MSYFLDEEKTWLQRDFGLDRRLIKALSKLGFVYPTLVQTQCLPIAIQGKDILCRARTGAGKTIAYALPVLQKVLSLKNQQQLSGTFESLNVKAVILAPTKELIKQIESHVSDLMYYCRDVVTLCSLSDDNVAVQKYRLQSNPDIIVSTPARLVQNLNSGAVALDLSNVHMFVLDEADLVLSFGYKDDVHTILSRLPKIFQGIFMSATLSPDLQKFKRLVLHKPVLLQLEEPSATDGGGNSQLKQYFLRCSEHDKYLVLYVFLKLGLLQGKGLIFVNDVNKCYKLKLFFQQFFISTAVLNSEVPANSRLHILEEYNRGVFDYLIATDSSADNGGIDELAAGDEGADVDVQNEDSNSGDDEAGNSDSDNSSEDDEIIDEAEINDSGGDDDQEEPKENEELESATEEELSNVAQGRKEGSARKETPKAANGSRLSSKSKKITTVEEYGVSRGIDFHGVDFVVNFDFPSTASSYTHRIGRTARGSAVGTAISLVSTVAGSYSNSTPFEIAASEKDEFVLHTVREQQPRLLGTSIGAGAGTGGQGALEEVSNAMDSNIVAAAGPIMDSTGGDRSSTINNNNLQYVDDRQPAPLQFNMRELESFRYRVEDTLRAVTVAAVRELRAAELKREILNSKKLATYFAENPNDLKVLRHDKAVAHPIRQKEHLKSVPSYLIPSSMRTVANTAAQDTGRRGRNNRKRRAAASAAGCGTSSNAIQKSKKRNPLFNLDNANNNESVTTYKQSSEAVPKVFTNNESLGEGMSGRKEWKLRHKKGKFNPKVAKRAEHRTPGSFIKSKNYK